MSSTPETGSRHSPPGAASDNGKSAEAGDDAICYRTEPSRRLLPHRPGNPTPSLTQGGDLGKCPPCLLCDQSHTVIDLEKTRRLALMVTPQAAGPTIDQAWEAVSTIRAILRQQPVSMQVTSQTVFLRHAEDLEPCRRLFEAYFGDHVPATNFIVQPPCGGQALAIEAWALGGEQTRVEFPRPHVVRVVYDGLQWTHVSGITPTAASTTAYAEAYEVFQRMADHLAEFGASFNDVARVWLYQGSITELEDSTERYRELNRARSDFFTAEEAAGRLQVHRAGANFYPASTGIGMAGEGLAASCLTLQTDRDDVRLVPLENPNQTSSFDYAPKFSKKSPKFSRAMAFVNGDYVTTWVSGTASIVDSETVHLGDVEKQTEQTINNIESLISEDNFRRHGVSDAGARLVDLAKVRVYIKHREDYEKCRAICERRFGGVPAIYAEADVCRSNLLVEIEGVAFSQRL